MDMQTASLTRVGDRHAELQAAFLAFGSVSTQLADVFEALRGEVGQLRSELGQAHAGKEHLAARLSALLRALPAGVLVIGPRGDIEECNPAALDLLGEPLIGQTFAGVLGRAAVDASRLHEHIELHGGRFVTISRRELEGDGNGGGEVVLIADVTEPHLMQVLMARQQRLLTLGELAAGLAHQIRTPLAAALLYASQMQLPHRTAADLAHCVDKTVASLVQLDKLVTDMLAFTSGGAPREVVQVGAVLEQAAQWLRPALRSGVTLTLRTEAPTLAVRVNASALISAVLNLATNSLQSTTGDLHLELLARRSASGRAEIAVSDDGPGVPDSLRERIFEPFFTTRTRGNGIGLAIVKSVALAHAGSVRLAPSTVGASFIIDLPAEEST
jgi:two-component system sensor histidine kinase FlrB